MSYSFNDKVVIVTGSNLGIGKVTAIALAKQGAKIVINARSLDRLEMVKEQIESLGAEVLVVQCDVTIYEDCKRMISQTLDKFHRIDVLINNVGTSSRGTFVDMDVEVFRKIMDVNFHGSVNTTKAALTSLIESQGRIMFISSVAGIRGLQNISPYCAAKMALTSLAESLKIELYRSGVRVGITYVGITRNEPEKRIFDADGNLISLSDRNNINAQTTEQVAKAILRNIANGKFKSVLTPLGKINYVSNILFPRLIDRILVRANEKVNVISK